jgi:hypothetical protein
MPPVGEGLYVIFAANGSDKSSPISTSSTKPSTEVEQRIARFTLQRDLLMTVPGVKQRTAGS